jgi:hypothetical protein
MLDSSWVARVNQQMKAPQAFHCYNGALADGHSRCQ